MFSALFVFVLLTLNGEQGVGAKIMRDTVCLFMSETEITR